MSFLSAGARSICEQRRSHRLRLQKSTRALNVIVLEPSAVVMRPNLSELMSVFGVPHIGLFSTFTASQRMVNMRRKGPKVLRDECRLT